MTMVDGCPCLSAPAAFQAQFANLKVMQLGLALEDKNPGKRQRHSGDAAARMKMLWSPFGKSLRLTAVRAADGSAARTSADVAEALTSS